MVGVAEVTSAATPPWPAPAPWPATWQRSLYWLSGLLVFSASVSCWPLSSAVSRKIAVIRNLSRTSDTGAEAGVAAAAAQWISTVADRLGARLPVLGRTRYFSGEVVLIL